MMVRVVRDPRQGRSSWDCGPEAGRTGQIRGPHKLSQASWRFWAGGQCQSPLALWTSRNGGGGGKYPEYSLEGLMLKLKLQYFGHLMRRTDSLEKTLILGKIEGRRRGDDRG